MNTKKGIKNSYDDNTKSSETPIKFYDRSEDDGNVMTKEIIPELLNRSSRPSETYTERMYPVPAKPDPSH